MFKNSREPLSFDLPLQLEDCDWIVGLKKLRAFTSSFNLSKEKTSEYLNRLRNNRNAFPQKIRNSVTCPSRLSYR